MSSGNTPSASKTADMSNAEGDKGKKCKLDWAGITCKDKNGNESRKSYTSMYIWFVVAVVVIWLILWWAKPAFVTDLVNGVPVLNNQKLLMWTLIFSILAWIVIYAAYYCRY